MQNLSFEMSQAVGCKQVNPSFCSSEVVRLVFLFLSAFILISCNISESTKAASDTLTAGQQSGTVAKKLERQPLIEELKQLKAVLSSRDKEKIADLFEFPIPDRVISFYLDDSTLNAQLHKNGVR
jgi:hypothetical protein